MNKYLNMTSKAVAITGGAGFIGSHPAGKLLKRQCKVTIIDNLLTGKLETMDCHMMALRHLPPPRVIFHG